MKIRLASKNDINEIAQLWVGLDHYNKEVLKQDKVFRDGIVGGKERYINLLNQHFNNKDIIVVTKVDGKIVGFVICYIINQFGNGNQDAVIDVTFVDESTRGQGVGKYMYDFLENYLKEKGVVGITTEVFDNNQMSVNFHEKMGFQYIAKAVEMYKKLN